MIFEQLIPKLIIDKDDAKIIIQKGLLGFYITFFCNLHNYINTEVSYQFTNITDETMEKLNKIFGEKKYFTIMNSNDEVGIEVGLSQNRGWKIYFSIIDLEKNYYEMLNNKKYIIKFDKNNPCYFMFMELYKLLLLDYKKNKVDKDEYKFDNIKRYRKSRI